MTHPGEVEICADCDNRQQEIMTRTGGDRHRCSASVLLVARFRGFSREKHFSLSNCAPDQPQV